MSEPAPYSDIILRHYRAEAADHGADTSSTMKDAITRGREVSAIETLVAHLRSQARVLDVLDIGCGNGYLLEVLRKNFSDLNLTGLEYTPEMVTVARGRSLDRVTIVEGDVRKLPFETASQDLVITERCIINVMDIADQERSFSEVGRVLRPGGHFICIEAFTDGLQQLNVAREELGLPPNQAPHHNLWFDKQWFLTTIGRDFNVVDIGHDLLPATNFLSSHYFISRVLYPSVTKREILYNSHLVQFFAFLPPIGNYSPIQLYLLQRH